MLHCWVALLSIRYTVIRARFKGAFTWIRIEFQSGSNSFRFSWDHRGLNYICLHESGLSCNSFRIKFIHFSCNSWMKLGMKSTFIVAEIKIVCKLGSFIHVFRCISAKITGKIFICRDPSILNSISHVNTTWVWSVVQDWNSIRIHVNYP